MRRHRSGWTWVAAACGLSIAGVAPAHVRTGDVREAGVLPDAITIPWRAAAVPADASLQLRTARERTIFIPQAEFLFAPAAPADVPPR